MGLIRANGEYEMGPVYNWQVFFRDGHRETGTCTGTDLMDAVIWFRQIILPTFTEGTIREFRISERVEAPEEE